jgi:hydroxymethylpyrimidine pyrophosphatase-like HAD family hydrolase
VSYRLLALDLDGTLLNRQGVVAERDRAAIASLQARGVVVTINTGRLVVGAMGAARACEIRGPIGCCDGSHLYDVSRDATIAHHPLPEDACHLLDELVGGSELTRYVFSTERAFCNLGGQRFADYVCSWSPDLAELEDLSTRGGAWHPHDALAQLVIGAPALIAAAAEAVATRLAGLYAVSFPVNFLPGHHAMLVRMRGPSKGTALGELCAHYGIALDEAVVAGDWWNDVPMFEVAGRSFAMAGAPEEVKDLATDRLPPGAGVADLIDLCWS